MCYLIFYLEQKLEKFFRWFFPLCVLILFSSCGAFIDWQIAHPDSIIEEAIEGYIENQTGYDIDLTPITGGEILNVKVSTW